MPVVPVTANAEAEPELDEIPEGSTHTAKLTSIKPKDISWVKDGERKEATLLNWRWEIIEGSFTGRGVFLTTNSDLELNLRYNRFRGVVETLLGRTLKESDPPLDTDDLIGMEANIQIAYRADKRNPERKYVEVGDVLPASDTEFSVDEPPF